MRLHLPSVIRLVSIAAALAGCYAPQFQDGKLKCANDGSCPDGMTCQKNGYCYAVGAAYTCKPACGGVTPLCDKATLSCVQCLADGDCPAGYLCAAGTCKPGCSSGHAGCAADAGSCDVDLGVCRGCLTDSECTSPGLTRCDAPSGLCLPCNPTKDNCPNGQYCAGASGTYKCMAGCKSAATQAADCGGAPKICCNNKCVDSSSDGANCGACGMKCTNCCAGACSDITTDPKNCGGCGAACAVPNATPGCAGSKCTVAMCNGGFADCNMDPTDGCEINTQTDPKNCSKCMMACPAVANAAAGCNLGLCGIAVCNPGFLDCDQLPANGCEVDSNNDINNCGKCATRCGGAAHANPSCTAGKCGIVCVGTYRDCNKNPLDGCESNILTDSLNCGVCGNACGPGKTCNGGGSCV